MSRPTNNFCILLCVRTADDQIALVDERYDSTGAYKIHYSNIFISLSSSKSHYLTVKSKIHNPRSLHGLDWNLPEKMCYLNLLPRSTMIYGRSVLSGGAVRCLLAIDRRREAVSAIVKRRSGGEVCTEIARGIIVLENAPIVVTGPFLAPLCLGSALAAVQLCQC